MEPHNPLADKPDSDSTIEYYNANDKSYFHETIGLDLSSNRRRFLRLLDQGAHILDLGCGSGRDSLAFLRQGHEVTAMDASQRLAALASAYIGRPVVVQTYQDIAYHSEFDAVWACASLLHCPKHQIGDVFSRLLSALKPGGVWYMSFKYGTGERFDEVGRLFNDYTCASLRNDLVRLAGAEIIEIWQETKELRGRPQTWVNALVRRSARGERAPNA